MRIVYLHQYFVTPSMAGGTRSYEMARRLVEAGHEVHMITSDTKRSGKPYETNEAGIRVTWIPVAYSNSMGTLARIKAFAEFAIKSARFAAKSPADVVFASSTPLTIAIPGIFAKWRQKVPMVFEVRDLWPEMPIALGVLKDPASKWLARWMERFAYRNAAQVVALSPGMKDGVVRTGYPADKVSVIPNACDIDRFSVSPEVGRAFRAEHEWLGDRKLVVYAGTLGELNGVTYLVEISAEMLSIDPEVRFLVVGSGKEEAHVRCNAERLGVLNKNFFMLPSVPKAEIPCILSTADICTSLFIDVREMWANSANKFFDALAAGRPIAINYGGWQSELVRSTGAGIMLDPKRPRKAAVVLRARISDEDWLLSAREESRNLAISRFDRDDLATRLSGVLGEAISSRTS